MLRLATHAMGTRFELVLAGEDDGLLRTVGEEALREIEFWHDRLSRFQPDSDIARLNRDGGGRVDAELFALLELCEQVRKQSGGAFDITVGRMMEELGFHPASPCRPESPAATAERLTLDPTTRTVRLSPHAALDLGAVAKGFALDRAAAILLEHGLTRVLLHGGTSSVIAIGEWPIAIRSDDEPLTLHLHDESLGVSAPRGRRVASASLPMSDDPGSKPGPSLQATQKTQPRHIGRDADATHILDPRTGLPARTLDTAAVIGPIGSAALCDAWSTALIVLGNHPATIPTELTSHLHASASGWRTHLPHPCPC